MQSDISLGDNIQDRMVRNDKGAPAIRLNVAIVGGGMVGLSLAIILAQLEGIERVAIFEKRSGGPSEVDQFDRRSTALSSGSIDILKKSGALVSDRTALHGH